MYICKKLFIQSQGGKLKSTFCPHVIQESTLQWLAILYGAIEYQGKLDLTCQCHTWPGCKLKGLQVAHHKLRQ